LRHDHLKADLDIGDVGSDLIGLAQRERLFVCHARGMPEGGVCQKMVTESLGKWAIMAHFPVRYDRVAGID
jgi:hypothetical protein